MVGTNTSAWVTFPKVELHRHLEGALRLSTLVEIAQSHKLDLPTQDPEGIRALVQVTDGEQTSEAFLAKFADLRRFFVSPEIITRLAYEAVADAAQDNVRYLELRFNPAALASARGLAFEEAIDCVVAGVRRAEADLAIHVGLIISINRAEPDTAEKILRVALTKLHLGIAGVDLTGDEVHAPADPYAALFAEARRGGLAITVHAGEWAGAENVRFAIEELGATRIGHGIRIIDDPEVIALARDCGTLFEVCITSNVQTGAVPSLRDHPAEQLYRVHKLNITLNTDDPSVSDILLSGEFDLAHRILGFSEENLRAMTLTAARHAFLAPEERERLVEQLTQEFGFREA